MPKSAPAAAIAAVLVAACAAVMIPSDVGATAMAAPGAGDAATAVTAPAPAALDALARRGRLEATRFGPAPEARPQPAGAARNARATRVALRYLGTPYVYGGSSPAGFDCSGLVSYAYAQVGVAMAHNTNAIWAAFPKVERDQLMVGDMVFFSGLGHVGIYVGHGRYVHSPHTGEVVEVAPMSERDDYVGAVRVS